MQAEPARAPEEVAEGEVGPLVRVMRSRLRHAIAALILAGLSPWIVGGQIQTAPDRSPAQEATGVSPDTHLALTFAESLTVGGTGQVRVYDADDGTVVDRLELSIPAGPTQLPAANAAAAADPPPAYQRTVIGGFTEGFHFYRSWSAIARRRSLCTTAS